MDEPVSFILRPEEAAESPLPLVLLAAPASASERLDLHRRMVAASAGCLVDGVSLAASGTGAPLPFSQAEAEPLFLSRSASGGCTALVLAREPVGVDVAREDGGRLPFAVLSVPDRQELAACPDEASRRRLFLRIWAAKEAYLKSIGTGLLRDPATIAIAQAASTKPRVVDPDNPATALRARLRLWTSSGNESDAGEAGSKQHDALTVLPEGAILSLCRIV